MAIVSLGEHFPLALNLVGFLKPSLSVKKEGNLGMFT